jgi:glycosyltransferase involved in cell wall biosynthesis
MAVMDIFLLTSLWEGLPRVIPQAMAMHLPVVAYRIDGTSDAICHDVTGFLADPGDIQAMVDLCIYLVDNPEVRKKIGEASSLFSRKEFDLNGMVLKIEALYRSLIRKKSIDLMSFD